MRRLHEARSASMTMTICAFFHEHLGIPSHLVVQFIGDREGAVVQIPVGDADWCAA